MWAARREICVCLPVKFGETPVSEAIPSQAPINGEGVETG